MEFAAQRALTYEVQESTLLDVTESILADNVREKTLNMIEETIDLHNEFFRLLRKNIVASDEDRKAISRDPALISLGKGLVNHINLLLEEFVFEGELFTIPEYELRLAEEFFEKYIF